MAKDAQNTSVRLDRFLAEQGGIPRKEATRLLHRGEVTVDGKTLRDGAYKLAPQRETVVLSGKELTYRKHVYIMLHKPEGVVCATQDNLHPTVLSLLPPELAKRVAPAGRLDIDTTGFVLLTDDGELTHRVISPRSHVPKEYHAVLERPCTEEDVRAFAEGLTLSSGERCLAAELTPSEDGLSASLILHEGKFHQVKRMFEAVGNRVLTLVRLRIGNISLDASLEPGQWREMLHKDVENLL